MRFILLTSFLLLVLPAAHGSGTTPEEKNRLVATTTPKGKPGYKVVDGEVTIKDGKRYINIYLKYDDGLGDESPRKAQPPTAPPPLTFSKYEYTWALDLLSQGKTREAAALFERCALVKLTCIYTLRDDLKMIPVSNISSAAYFNAILLRIVEKNIDKKYYAQLLRMLDPLHLTDIKKTLGLIHKALHLHGEMEELRILEEQIYAYNL